MVQREIVETRVMDAPRDAVWRVVTDTTNAAQVLRGVEKIEVLEGEVYEVGLRWRETRRILGRSASEEMEVVAVEPGVSTRIEAWSSGVRYTTIFELQAIGPKTRVVVHFRGDPTEEAGAVQKSLVKLFGGIGAIATSAGLRRDLGDIEVAAAGTPNEMGSALQG
ncbi:polyketide cyclase/dehydrase/lipid transport protein [Cellulomonas sp. PhB143]|nr:SRPBCC family protein [Cellulomonas sp. PhB143]ROS75284.1 polyketide cyclase/dehydrase/lipid transport protein [Cellulomonas sp. PhB143]